MVRARDSAVSSDEAGDDVQLPLYCYCQNPEEGDMVGCDNPILQISIVSFQLYSLLKCKYWYCPDCRNYLSVGKRHSHSYNHGCNAQLSH